MRGHIFLIDPRGKTTVDLPNVGRMKLRYVNLKEFIRCDISATEQAYSQVCL